MIPHQLIKDLVGELGLREDIIEKDYVIGWLLWGIGSDPNLTTTWVFKGGTCLKKCYRETYRCPRVRRKNRSQGMPAWLDLATEPGTPK